MAVLSITAASVVPSSTAVTVTETAGATITAGQMVYRDSSDSNHCKLASDAGATTDDVWGIAANGASDGQPLEVVRQDTALAIGSTVEVGVLYVLGASGAIQPAADMTTGEYFTLAGWGVSVTELSVNFSFSGNTTSATHA